MSLMIDWSQCAQCCDDGFGNNPHIEDPDFKKACRGELYRQWLDDVSVCECDVWVVVKASERVSQNIQRIIRREYSEIEWPRV